MFTVPSRASKQAHLPAGMLQYPVSRSAFRWYPRTLSRGLPTAGLPTASLPVVSLGTARLLRTIILPGATPCRGATLPDAFGKDFPAIPTLVEHYQRGFHHTLGPSSSVVIIGLHRQKMTIPERNRLYIFRKRCMRSGTGQKRFSSQGHKCIPVDTTDCWQAARSIPVVAVGSAAGFRCVPRHTRPVRLRPRRWQPRPGALRSGCRSRHRPALPGAHHHPYPP